MEGAGAPLCPGSVDELSQLLRDSRRIRLSGHDSKSAFRLPLCEPAERVSTQALKGVVHFVPEDQVVVVRAGTRLADLQAALAERGQCIPLQELWPSDFPRQPLPGTVAGALSMNLPHFLEAECGTWRDWVLGVTVVLADGTVAKSGSRAVKNVAGYDLMKLFIGARGTLGVLVEVILRTYPLASLPSPDFQLNGREGDTDDCLWIQRVLPSDFEALRTAASGYPGVDVLPTATLKRLVPPDAQLPRFAGDWVMRSGCGAANLRIEDPTMVRLMQRAKTIFDPQGKLNPGEFGIG